MTEFHKLSEVLTEHMNLFPKGTKVIFENSENWTLEIEAQWNSKRINLTIKSRKSNAYTDFTTCEIKKAPFLSLVARYDNYKLSGNDSEVSNILLTSPVALNLLKARKGSFVLHGEYLIYTCRLGRKDKKSVSNIFILIQKLNQEIDTLTDNKYL